VERATALRRELHRHPDRSGDEAATARRIAEHFAPLRPDHALAELGGAGLAFVFGGDRSGPTVLLRCELDALPIHEELAAPWASSCAGTSHKCGHDGHMAILAAVGAVLAERRPARGCVVLLYQPAEETGAGAAAVVADPRFGAIRPDRAFALHNLPGFPLGRVVVRAGTFSCASRGVVVRLRGRAAHAAQPETGVSPARAMCRLVERLEDLPAPLEVGDELAFVTVVGARLGERAFGTAPGHADVAATLRCETDGTMERLCAAVEASTRALAEADGLRWDVGYEDVFDATTCSLAAVDVVRRAAGEDAVVADRPFRWSEDFGRLSALGEGALFGLGAGEHVRDLHDPAYDFPDELIATGAELFLRIVDECLAGASDGSQDGPQDGPPNGPPDEAGDEAVGRPAPPGDAGGGRGARR